MSETITVSSEDLDLKLVAPRHYAPSRSDHMGAFTALYELGVHERLDEEDAADLAETKTLYEAEGISAFIRYGEPRR